MIKKATLLIAAIVLLVGCQTVRVSQDYAVGTDFNQFKPTVTLNKELMRLTLTT